MSGMLGFHSSLCQVSNNEIQNRIKLQLNSEWYSSSTRHASVEWDCINKVLTNTCLVYHNDQWFTFIPPETGTYFINISNQKCSNQQGVQIVVLEGDPCKISSYQLKMCISYTDQSDMFVRIDSLIGGKEYLLNIDGYLGDQCEFLIQFSTKNNGIPVQAKNLKAFALEIKPMDSIISVHWFIPDSLVFKMSNVNLFRKHEKEKTSMLIYSSSLQRNSYGQTITDFTIEDTLRREGQYSYSVYGNSSDNQVLLLARENFAYRRQGKGGTTVFYRADIDFNAPKNGLVTVAVLDDRTEKPLFSTNRRIVKGKNKLILDLSEYVKQGVHLFKIVISDKTFRQEHRYRVRKHFK